MTTLHRTLGLPALTLYGLGTILGAGIYSVLGAAAGQVGEGVWQAFLLSAVAALLAGLSYAELATTWPEAGAEYVYLRKAVPRWRWAPFAAGLLVAVSGAATAATVSLAFAGYLGEWVPLPAPVLALGLVALLTAIALQGVRHSTAVTGTFTVVEAAGLVLVVAAGATVEGFGEALLARPTWQVFGGASLVFFAYLGFENIVSLVEETREPERTVPRALLLALAISTALYVLVALAAVALLPPADLARSPAPLADAARAVSPRIAGALGGIAVFATANTGLASIVSRSRLLFGMARGGDLPPALARVLPKRRTPWAATLAVALAAAALVPLGDVAVVASLSSFASLAAFTSVHAAVLVLRFRDPDRPRPFRVPGTLGRLPLLPAAGAATTLLLLTQLAPVALLAGSAVLVALVGVHAVWGRRKDPRPR